jgi:hypothetical protein
MLEPGRLTVILPSGVQLERVDNIVFFLSKYVLHIEHAPKAAATPPRPGIHEIPSRDREKRGLGLEDFAGRSVRFSRREDFQTIFHGGLLEIGSSPD